jgi:hypothetical protein
MDAYYETKDAKEMTVRALYLIPALLLATPAWAQDAVAPAMTPPVAAAAAAPYAGKSRNVHLGKIQVSGMKALVETLQEIKVAVKRPFDDDPAHFDEMVCRLDDRQMDTHIGAVLECGTQGWFGMRRSEYRYGGAMSDGAVAAALGHPWQTERTLNPEQTAALRDLLRGLPVPGAGKVQLVVAESRPAR